VLFIAEYDERMKYETEKRIIKGPNKKSNMNSRYGLFMDNVRKTTKKTADVKTFREYEKLVLTNIRALGSTFNEKNRKKVKMKHKRIIDSSIVKICKEFTNKKEEIIAKLKNKDNRDIIVVAFVGNGTFKAQKGHISAPTKKLLKELSRHMIVIIVDEYNTSKKCPYDNCDCDLKDAVTFFHIRKT